MWSYFGNKTNMVDYYPKPKFNKIIEPFAGTAQYSLKYFDRDILLIDKYETIIKIWHFLQQASPNDILKLPRLKQGDRIDEIKFDCEGAKLLMGFLIGFSTASPRITTTSKLTERPNFINYNLRKIANNLYKIKHWKIEHGTFEQIKNEQATWFIDPPYQYGGEWYKESNKNINYDELLKFVETRHGQVIVCENDKATWMKFLFIKKMRTARGYQRECLWTNEKTIYNNIQQKIEF